MRSIALVATVLFLVSCSAPLTSPIFIDNKIKSIKKGKSCARAFLFFFNYGDSSVNAAKENAMILEVATVEASNSDLFGGVYKEVCTVVTGQ